MEVPEIKELKEGRIDPVQDEGVNTVADLRILLKTEAAKALTTLRTQIDKLAPEDFSDREKEALYKEGERLILEIYLKTMHDLTISQLRVACSQLSDITGFILDIDEEGLDQFGLEQRRAARSQQYGTGFESYKKEKTKNERIEGLIESAQEHKEMALRLDTPQEDIDGLLGILKKQGEAHYESFGPKGPVLLVLPEIHYDSNLLRQNAEVMLEAAPYIALLATEGIWAEVTQDHIEGPGTREFKDFEPAFAKNEVMISSEVVEKILGDKVYTMGVENFGTLLFALRTIMEMGWDETNKERLKKREEEISRVILQDGVITREEFIKAYEGNDALPESYERILIRYRNQIWLDTIQEILLNQTARLSSRSNIVFLVCGAGHQADLLKQAQERGFKGVIHYTPSSFKAPFNPTAVALAYQKGQLRAPKGKNSKKLK